MYFANVSQRCTHHSASSHRLHLIPQEPGEVRPPCVLPWFRWVDLKIFFSISNHLKQNKLSASPLIQALGWRSDHRSLTRWELCCFSVCVRSRFPDSFAHIALVENSFVHFWTHISVFSIIEVLQKHTDFKAAAGWEFVFAFFCNILPEWCPSWMTSG